MSALHFVFDFMFELCIKLLALKYSWTLTLENDYHKVEYELSPAEHLSTKVNKK